MPFKDIPRQCPQYDNKRTGTFQVQIIGETEKSYQINAWSFNRLSTLLKDKLSEYSSTRSIEVRSKDGTSRFYDLFQAIRYGELNEDPYIQSGDTIILHHTLKMVTITGQVKYPGTYEVLAKDSLQDIIEDYAGGLTTFADKNSIEILRKKSGNSLQGESFYLDISQSIPDSFILEDYDSIRINETLDYLPVVYIQGAVGNTQSGTDSIGYSSISNKITQPIISGERLLTVIRGLQEDENFSIESDLKNAFLIRNATGVNIPVNIEQLLLQGGVENDPVQFDGDIVVIPFRQYLVYVSGQVNKPGVYPYIVNKTFDYYVGLAGGFNIDNHIGKKVKIYDVNGDRHSYKKRIIEPEDVICAPLNHPLYWL